ncbi:MAG: hypothetical protein ABWK05_02335 [Pyrobaculum sp.]
MRRFLVSTTLEKFTQLPHIHAKILVAGLLVSNGVRKDAEVAFYLVDKGLLVRILGDRVRRLFPDEESSVGFLKKAFSQRPQPGVVVKRGSPLLEGVVVGPSAPRRCLPSPPFTYVIPFVEFKVEYHCGAGLGDLPPHHQVAVLNIEVDRKIIYTE